MLQQDDTEGNASRSDAVPLCFCDDRTVDRIAVFRQLHQSGCFVIPNPWDLGSARVLAHLGFRALATTSAGFAWSIGRPDNGVTVDDVLGHLRAIAQAVHVPVNADFEGGFAIEPEGVAANVTRGSRDRHRRPLDRGFDRRCVESVVRFHPGGRTRPRGPPRD